MPRLSIAILGLVVSFTTLANVNQTGSSPSCPSGQQITYTPDNGSGPQSSLDSIPATYPIPNAHDYGYDHWSGDYTINWTSGTCGTNGCNGGALTIDGVYSGGTTVGHQYLGTITASCAVTPCGSKQGIELGTVKPSATYNPDGTPHYDVKDGDSACVNNCLAVAETSLDVTAGTRDNKVFSWAVVGADSSQNGTACNGQPNANPNPTTNGFGCTSSGSIPLPTGCVNTTTKAIGDAADYIRDGKDQGPSAAPVSAFKGPGCVTLASGGAFCTSDTPPPQLPDNGNPGVPATPTSTNTLDGPACPQGATTCTFSYYSTQQINTSSNYGNGATGITCPKGQVAGTDGKCGSSGGTTTSGGTTGGGSTGGDGTGNSLSGGLDCGTPPSCDGDPVACYQARQDWTLACVYKTPEIATLDSTIDSSLTPTTPTGNGTILPTIETPDASDTFNGLLGTGGFCTLHDMSIPAINGITSPINLPLSNANALVVPTIRIVILAVAAMFALRITTGARD